MSETVQVTENPNWIEITLNRPDRLNAFNEEMHLALRDAIGLTTKTGARALLITGAGRGFCAGQDLSDRDPAKGDAKVDLGHTVRQFYNPLVRSIRALEIPVVCAVNGVAAGAGVSLAMACDMVLAARSASFIQSFAKVGLIPDSGGSWHLTRRLGEARAKGLAMTGGKITAEQAMNWGLIWDICEDADLIDRARTLVTKLANGPTLGLGLTKQAIQAASHNAFEDHLTLEADYMQICGQSADYAEGVRAFLEKRPARFKGK